MTRALWVVEARKADEDWLACAAKLSRDDARRAARKWRQAFSEHTRVVRYVPAPKDGETFA